MQWNTVRYLRSDDFLDDRAASVALARPPPRPVGFPRPQGVNQVDAARIDSLFGKIGIGVALAVFLGVNYFWSDFASLLQSMGWRDLSESIAAAKQRKLVAAVLAFAALVPVLILQVVLKRRALARDAAGDAEPGSPEAD